MMKLDRKLWRDTNEDPIPRLVHNMALASMGFIPFSALAGACFTLAFCGGTEFINPWQWSLCGGAVSLLIGFMALGCFRLRNTINDRILASSRDVPA